MPGAWELFCTFIENRYQLNFRNNARQLAWMIENRCRELGITDHLRYLDRIKTDQREEVRFIDEITTGETAFFRYSAVFDNLRRYFASFSLPQTLSILHIGCSTGAEPYTIAILLDETGAFSRCQVIIHAIDINAVVIERARLGVYQPNILRNVRDSTRKCYFLARHDGSFELIPSVRERVQFYTRSIFELPQNPLLGKYDIIFCMNVMIYMTAPALSRAIAILQQLSQPKSKLIVAPTDAILQMNQNFTLHQEDGFHWYSYPPNRKREIPAANPISVAKVPPRPTSPLPSAKIPPVATVDFYAEGRRAYDKKDFEKAQALFAEGIRQRVALSHCYLGLAQIYADEGKRMQAVENAEQALVHDSENSAAYLLLGVLNLEADHMENAEQYFERALQIKPSCKESRMFLDIMAGYEHK